jgi:glutamate synthase (ferredoxin)
LDGSATHRVVKLALETVERLAHRGAVDGDAAATGDGAGVLTQLPVGLLRRELEIDLPEPGSFGLGMLFLPVDPERARRCRTVFAEVAEAAGIPVLAWRVVPTCPDGIGRTARDTCPAIEQVVFGRPDSLSESDFEFALYRLRRAVEKIAIDERLDELYICSLSARTVVYKGLLVASQLTTFYPDLADEEYTSAIAVFHQRYSTNTFPNWERSQPMRMLAHNGEVNTLQGNVNWMRAREALLGDRFPGEIVDTRGSDSAMLDNVLELLAMGGRDVRHALTMLVPPAWEQAGDLPPQVRAFFSWHAGLMEPWDGPAALSVSDGRWACVALDRNGLRPARYVVTADGLVACSSEAGSVPVDPATIIRNGKLGPGQMVAVDTATGTLWLDEEIKDDLAKLQPWSEWLDAARTDVGRREVGVVHCASDTLLQRQAAFGYTREELTVVLRPMLEQGKEPVGSMGDDTPHAVLADRPRPLFSFFKQRFAEVTNPPIDPIRERSVMSLTTLIGRRMQLLEDSASAQRLIRLQSPVLTDAELRRVHLAAEALDIGVCEVATVMTAETAEGAVEEAIERVCSVVESAIDDGNGIIVLSDRSVDARRMPIPALAVLGAVHHHLIAVGKRMAASLIVDSGEPRDVHQVATLIGYGANAVCPWLAIESCVDTAVQRGERIGITPPDAVRNYATALETGLLKVMSKMGIATVDSYCGAQIFEAVGLGPELIDRCFPGTPSRMGGIGFDQLHRAMIDQHDRAWREDANTGSLESPGFYKFKRGGERHAFNPAMVRQLQLSVAEEDVLGEGFAAGFELYQGYVEMVHEGPPSEPRDLLQIVPAGDPIPLEEVEPWESIVARFSTGAMSHGSLSSEAHETLAEAMNRLGAMSNSGEGGEDADRFGTVIGSAIKQVASARFGVTPAYLQSARELQIKMAQGSKPGEGGQLPGHKVTDEIARIRHTVPGVALISPPPHHDIYSIEDLAQLIYDMRAAHPAASVTVKLVGQAGVGTIAAGVAKANADGILISGHAGGTGASPLSSIKNAGMPWEVGLSETQQTLMANGLRGRVRLRVDGGLRTGRDVVTAALLGADQYSFGTVALVAAGCLMARACHNNSCPVGIATQRRELRDKFPGNAERVMAYMRFVAEEVRITLASLGLRSLDEAVGRVELLKQDVRAGSALELGALLASPSVPDEWPRRYTGEAIVVLEHPLNDRIMDEVAPQLSAPGRVSASFPIENTDRAIPSRLAGAIAREHGDAGRGESVALTFTGSAGQSFGAFCGPDLQLDLIGEANDYVGKGLAGAEIAIRPVTGSLVARNTYEQYIAGNTCLYGATSGTLFAAGRVGERFAVRNSGAVAVVEGLGDHGCEYMTGGVVVVLGRIGRNFGAGMTGGVAYILDLDGSVPQRLNTSLVEALSPTPEQLVEVRQLIERHVQRTDSGWAASLLATWETTAASLLRIQPIVTEPETVTEDVATESVAAPTMSE